MAGANRVDSRLRSRMEGVIKSHRGGFCRGQVKREVVKRCALHSLPCQTGTVQHVSPRCDSRALAIEDQD